MLYMAYNKISKNEIIKKGVEEKMLYFIITILALCIFVMFVKIDSMTFDLMEKQSLIEASRKDLFKAEIQVVERSKMINKQAEHIKCLESRITDLENNVEFLYNNLSPAKKKLARPDNQN